MKILNLIKFFVYILLYFIVFNKRKYYKQKIQKHYNKLRRKVEINANIDNNINIPKKSEMDLIVNVNGKGNNINIKNLYGCGKITINVSGNDNDITIDSLTTAGKLSVFCHCNKSAVKIKELMLEENLEIYNGYQPFYKNIDNCNITIGANTSIGSGFVFNPHSNTQIKIGDNCMLSSDISIRNTDGHPIYDINTNECLNKVKAGSSIEIGNHVWIGASTTILKNSAVPDDSIVGTQAVVTKKYTEPNIAVAGNPAKVVKQGITWTRENTDFFD